jgi:glucose/arabinose dehydrogenase
VSTTAGTKVFALSHSSSINTNSNSTNSSSSISGNTTESSVARRVTLPEDCSAPAQRLAFTPDGCRLVAALPQGRVTVIQLPSAAATAAAAASATATASGHGSGDVARTRGSCVHTFAQPPPASRLASKQTAAAFTAGVSGVTSSSTNSYYSSDEDSSDAPVTSMCVSADGQWLALCTSGA